MKILYVSHIFISFVAIQNLLVITTLATSPNQMQTKQANNKSASSPEQKNVIFKDSNL